MEERLHCSVCWSTDTEKDSWSALLKCGHVFHTPCLEQALECKAQCPVCRVRSRLGLV